MCKAVKSGQYPFVMCNFAPPDMVGHTGKYEPAVTGCEATGESFSLVPDRFARRSIRPTAVLSVFFRFARCVFVVLQAWGKGLSVNTATALVESKLNYKITSHISMFIVFLSVVCHRANRHNSKRNNRKSVQVFFRLLILQETCKGHLKSRTLLSSITYPFFCFCVTLNWLNCWKWSVE